VTRLEGIDRGRNDLERWQEAQSKNYFDDDSNFIRLLQFYLGDQWLERHRTEFSSFGKLCATVVNSAAEINNRNENLPRLERFDGIGRGVEAVLHHPSHLACGKAIYGSGMMALLVNPGGFAHSLALFYISSQNSEAGHNCPVACTAGVVRVLTRVAHADLRERYLARLIDPNFETNFTGAQFLTEVQGGSDVGANACYVTQERDGLTYRLHGEKWFCSNADADLFLVTARHDESSTGTRGLGLFLVPRRLESGEVNSFCIRRLKDKLGTRSMASGELDFAGSLAYAVGPPENGFKTVMENVIHLSRIYNSLAVGGGLRRAYLVALTYAKHRRAFGQPIADYPLVAETLAGLRLDSAAALSGALYCCRLQDRIDTRELEGEENAYFQRTLANLNKYRSAYTNSLAAVRAIEVLGGNGTIETFSILPRLLRDALVCENWEGTHNTLFMQTLRDFQRLRTDQIFTVKIAQLLEQVGHAQLAEFADRLKRWNTAWVRQVRELADLSPALASLHSRDVVGDMANLYYATIMATEAQWELAVHQSRGKLDLLRLFLWHHAPDSKRQKDQDYLGLIQRVAGQG
jgi:alkylation response protein AidB-like acyl-CoA dehydrogenase